jgi:hypothetical protein
MHNANYVHEEWQTRNIGDTVWFARKDRYRGNARETIAFLTPNRAMMLGIKHRAEECTRWLTLYGNPGCPGN